MSFFQDLWHFCAALLGHWYLLLSGVVAAFFGYWERFRSPVPTWVWRLAALGALVLSGFFSWRDQRDAASAGVETVVQLKAEIERLNVRSVPPMIEVAGPAARDVADLVELRAALAQLTDQRDAIARELASVKAKANQELEIRLLIERGIGLQRTLEFEPFHDWEERGAVPDYCVQADKVIRSFEPKWNPPSRSDYPPAGSLVLFMKVPSLSAPDWLLWFDINYRLIALHDRLVVLTGIKRVFGERIP